MDEYISREAIVKEIKEEIKTCDVKFVEDIQIKKGLKIALKDIKAAKATDVQPVNRWISVKDRLPEPEKDVLVWYRYTWGAGFTSYRFGISKWYSNIKRWYEGCLPKDIEVLYWQPLSEPPKDGDK